MRSIQGFNNKPLLNAQAGKEWTLGYEKQYSWLTRVYIKGGERLTRPNSDEKNYIQTIIDKVNRPA